jgi:hypothetical protein
MNCNRSINKNDLGKHFSLKKVVGAVHLKITARKMHFFNNLLLITGGERCLQGSMNTKIKNEAKITDRCETMQKLFAPLRHGWKILYSTS